MKEPVLCNCLSQLNGLGENLRPCFDCREVFIHSLAGFQSSFKLGSESSIVNDCFCPLLILKISNKILSINVELLRSIETSLNLGELVVASKAIDHSCNEIWDS